MAAGRKRKDDDTTTTDAEFAASRARWETSLEACRSLPPSWPVCWRPDGARPCRCCGGRQWWQRAGEVDARGYGPGFCCTTCYPPPPGLDAERIVFAPADEAR